MLVHRCLHVCHASPCQLRYRDRAFVDHAWAGLPADTRVRERFECDAMLLRAWLIVRSGMRFSLVLVAAVMSGGDEKDAETAAASGQEKGHWRVR